MELYVREVCQTASGGSHVTIFEAEVELTSVCGVSVEISGNADHRGRGLQCDARKIRACEVKEYGSLAGGVETSPVWFCLGMYGGQGGTFGGAPPAMHANQFSLSTFYGSRTAECCTFDVFG